MRRIAWLFCGVLSFAAESPPVLTLDEAIALAIKGNRQVQIGALDVSKAGEATAEARTARLPQFKTYILGGVALNPINFTIPQGALGTYPTVGPIPGKDANITTPQTFTGLIYGSAAQPLSQLYKIRLGILASQLGEQLARENLRQKKQDTAQQVRQAYYQLTQIQSQIVSAEAALKYLTELSALTDRNLAEETVLKSDSLNVKAKLVSEWERGEKRPQGPSLKLLALVQKKGLEAIA